jgi:glycosyltransferase involved in cell wall biosynthesis
VVDQPKTKIAYIVPTLDAGGAERFILDLIKNLDQTLFSPTLVLFNHGGFFVTEALKAKIELVVLTKRFKFDPLNFWQLYRTIRQIKPTIVHTQLGGDIYGRLVARLLAVPIIISTEQNVQHSESIWIRRLKRWTAKFATKIVAISQAVQADMIARYGLPENQTEVIHNGLEIDKFLVSARKPHSAQIIFGSIGRLTEQKNYGLLLDALATLKDYNWQFRLVGEGELRPTLEQQIQDLGLTERVKLLGLQADIRGFLSGLDVFVLPSLWEGLGIVLLEAGLAGLPVVAARVDGISEIITDGATGLLFESNNREDLIVKLKQVLDNIDQPEVAALGENLQLDIQARFDIKTIAHKYQDLYLNLLARK